MEQKENPFSLLIHPVEYPVIDDGDAELIGKTIQKFITDYVMHKDTMSIEDWLLKTLENNLPESNLNLRHTRDEIIESIKINDDKLTSIETAINNGQSKESWLAQEIARATSFMSTTESIEYLKSLDTAVTNANNALERVAITKLGELNQNANLDGFIAEHYHVETFNMNASASGSSYRAKVLEPNGKRYSKNSVDIVIVDKNGKIVRKYQSKYYKNNKSTSRAFRKGDYRGQRKLVPDGQENSSKTTNRIEAPDGTKSNPLKKSQAERIKNEAQRGKIKEFDWNDYNIKDLTIGIGKEVVYAGLYGIAMGTTLKIGKDIVQGESVEVQDVIKAAVLTGGDFGVKAAVAGSLKVLTEKGLINILPPGTPAGVFGNIAYVGIENIKCLSDIANNKMTLNEGIQKMQLTTVSTIAGIIAVSKGATIGANIGLVLGPIGSVLGGLIGSTIGYLAGSTFASTAISVKKKLKSKVKNILQNVFVEQLNRLKSINNKIKLLY